jgi:hypothetical protein
MVRVRVDLHGVSIFGPGDRRTLIRWEAITSIEVADGVLVRSQGAELTIPPRAFGLEAAHLAARLEAGKSIVDRPDVIGELSGGASSEGGR